MEESSVSSKQSESRLEREILELGGRLPVAMVAACPFPATRGTPIRIQQMGEALSRQGYDVHVVTYHLGNAADAPGMTVHRTRRLKFYEETGAGPNYAKLLVLDPLLTHKLYQVVKEHGIRIIHAHHFEGALCALAVKKRIPGVQVIYDAHTSLRDELYEYDFRLPRFLKKAAAEILDSGIPRWCDHVITVSEALRTFIIERGVPSQKVTVIPMGVNSGEFQTIPTDEARKELDLGPEPLAVYTGNQAPFQGVGHLMRSFKLVLDKSPECRLALVGKTNPDHEEQAKALGISHRVTFVGERSFPEVQVWLAAADAVMLPRDNCIGFPLKLLNYMAMGRAIVAFKGGSANVLQHLKNAYVAPDGDESEFAEGILKIFRDRRLAEDMGHAAQETAGDFDVSAMERRITQLYQSFQLTGRPHYRATSGQPS